MSDDVARIAELARELSHTLPLEEQLQHTVDCAAAILGAPRASVRLFDGARARLIAKCRFGEPLHPGSAAAEFRVGEGLIGWIAAHNQSLRTGDAPSDARFVKKSEVVEPFASFIGVPLTSGNVCFGVISATSPAPNAFSEAHESLLSLLAGLCAPHLEMARLARLAAIDPLTGVFNRRGLDLVMPEHDARMASVAMCDLDRFKHVNDVYGHAAGDELLRRVAHLLASVVRAADGVVRWGGEEFLLVLPGVDRALAQHIVERARKSIEDDAIVVGGNVLRITISVGVAERHPGEARDSLIARADEALYIAKNSGRNRVELAA
ncbi:MAG TPA: sensor domain-containing diguanylate cyclase [Polyangia bacterium]|jgi:diguanylate cyclase (GGDEF)-like protein